MPRAFVESSKSDRGRVHGTRGALLEGVEPQQDRKNPPLRTVVGVIATLAIVASVGIFAVYNRRDEGKIGTAQTTGASVATSHLQEGVSPDDYGKVNTDAHERITAARCDREERCQTMGGGKRYTGRKTCERERRTQANYLLPAEKCSRGIPADRVNACVTAIAAAKCDMPAESFDELAPCTAQALCQ
ncbi:DUF6184 family natural product biosynthesis lipoprotein [Pendulispora brunnea]|uniref:DUF6184 family natural product biosynthesis lipoprotein n=1 Tax=Pendulispora brunnea TaxID=2905690 RepID=A0ABZ2K5H7_9BACT